MGLNYFGIKFDVTDFADMDISYELPLHTVQYWSCSFVQTKKKINNAYAYAFIQTVTKLMETRNRDCHFFLYIQDK